MTPSLKKTWYHVPINFKILIRVQKINSSSSSKLRKLDAISLLTFRLIIYTVYSMHFLSISVSSCLSIT